MADGRMEVLLLFVGLMWTKVWKQSLTICMPKSMKVTRKEELIHVNWTGYDYWALKAKKKGFVAMGPTGRYYL